MTRRTITPYGPAVRTARVYCVRCWSTYRLGFNSSNRALSPKCPRLIPGDGEAKKCGHSAWSYSCRADVEKLCAANENAVWEVVHEFCRRRPLDLLNAVGGVDEVAAEAFAGLVYHAHRFEPNRVAVSTGKPVKFVTYLMNGLPRYLAMWMDEQMRLGACGAPVLNEKWVRETVPHVRIDITPGGDENHPLSFQDQRTPCPVEEASKTEYSEQLEDALKHLDKRHRIIIEMRTMNGTSLKKVGERLGISKERTRQLEIHALVVLAEYWNVETPEVQEIQQKLAAIRKRSNTTKLKKYHRRKAMEVAR